MNHLSSLFAAYTVVWVAIFLYVLTLDRRSRRIARDVEELRKRVK